MHYLDHAATTPLLPVARAAIDAELDRVGNPSSVHAAGRAARAVVESARERLAAAFGVDPIEVLFTSGGTEGDNLGVAGLFRARRDADPLRTRIVLSPTEHHAVDDTARWLAAHDGAELVWLAVDPTGRVDPESLRAALRDPSAVALVSVMWANNEIGTVQPIAELAAIAREHGVPMHTDAVQAAGPLHVDLSTVDVDVMTITGHKLGGPVGTGALMLRRGVVLQPVLHGGGQERQVRSGTLDTAGAAGFAAAVDAVVAGRADTVARVSALRDRLVGAVRQAVPDVIVTGEAAPRLPGTAHFLFPECDGDALLMLLDAAGIAASTGAACSSGVTEPSHVLAAIGVEESLARGALRCSLGWSSTDDDVAATGAVIGGAVQRARLAAAVR